MSMKRNILVVGLVALAAFFGGVVQSQTERFELEGNLKFFGIGNGVIFPDGSKQISAASLSAPCFNDNTNRYIDCGNGTVTDTVTGLIWLKDAECGSLGNPAGRTYAAASSVTATTLANGVCGLTDGSRPGDWRLPTRDEWMATVAPAVALGCVGVSPPASPPSLTNDPGTACLSLGPTSFTGVTATTYWSSTANETTPSNAFSVVLLIGGVFGASKDSVLQVWPVRDP